MTPLNVLLLGSGGREHALAWAISASPLIGDFYCAPGNPGIARHATCVALDIADHQAIVSFCRAQRIGFVVVGPEAPLVAGLADDLEAAGIKVFGPSKGAAQLEGSKGFTKDFCAEFNIPTASYGRFTDRTKAIAYVKEHGAPIVIKADGLAAGKGVTVAMTSPEALEAVDHVFAGQFGAAECVIEEFLEGEEASFFALCDGGHALALAAAQDHKRVGDGDTGPNTGGMGAYSPAPIISPEMAGRVMAEIIRPTVAGMKKRGLAFKGVLFAGLMIGKSGPKLIEYNVRFGDPECQVLMLRLKDDLLTLLVAAVDGTLDKMSVRWRDAAALSVVMAAKGYPGAYGKGSEIRNLDKAGEGDDVEIFQAGTAMKDGRLVANGGRVLNVSALGRTVAEAQARAYAAVDLIDWPEGFCRRDIGWRAVGR
ncbi:MAG: phosphoribosylamine--glycine ligase [Parvibaculaceae bacterium]